MAGHRLLKRAALASVVALLAASSANAQAPAAETGRDRLMAYLNGLAADHTAARREAIAALRSPEDARLRQVRVRALLAEMIDFETVTGPVASQTTGVIHEDGFDVEKVWYESLPGYRVTGDVYVPTGRQGPRPAIIIQPGHGVDGKIGNYGFAANLARAGFIVLAIDIVGEGERIAWFDPDIGASKVGRPTGEHSMMFGQSLPTGGHVSRYFIQDAMRGVDYLMARPDVDDQKIGAFGCSGGGTMTAYLAALDPRIKAAATACYITTTDTLWAPGETGPQDAEQSIPYFVERGLDLPDWVEAVAPRPYAVVSTTEDMFPIAGARAAYHEAKRFYGLMDAEDRIEMIEGPGGHGNLGPIAPRIVAFFTRWLMDDAAERPFTATPLGDAARLEVTPTGQLTTSIGTTSIQAMALAEADRERPAAPAGETDAQRLQRLRVAIRDITRTSVSPATAPPMGSAASEGRTISVSLEPASGLTVPAVLNLPQGSGRQPVLLLLSNQPPAAVNATVEAWTRAGWAVMRVEPRGAGGTEEAKSPLTGDWTLMSLRALQVGRTPVGMRTDDAIAALNWLSGRSDIDMGRVAVRGVGALGPVALHAAVLDDRIGAVTVENGLMRYRDFVERPISINMAETNLPGVLERYDLPDLMAVLGDRLTLVNPVNSIGEVIPADQARAIAPAASVTFRAGRDPAPPPPSAAP